MATAKQSVGGAMITALSPLCGSRRTAIGPFKVEDSQTIQDLINRTAPATAQ